MTASECRASQRYKIRLSMRVQLVDSPEMSEQITESIDISTWGVFFASALPLKVGTPVEVFLENSRELTGEPSSEWRWKGQVVHVRPYVLPFGKSGVGIRFDSWELVKIAELLAGRDSDLRDGNDQV